MSATSNTATSPAPAGPVAPAEPQPWRSATDAEGWRRVPRTSGATERPLISVQIVLDTEQSDWLRAAARRAGVGYVQFIKELIERTRAAARSSQQC